MTFEYYIQLLTLFVAKTTAHFLINLRAYILSSSYFREEYVYFVIISQNYWPNTTL